MKNTFLTLAAAAVLAFAGNAMAQSSASTTGTIGARVIAPITISQTIGLRFGNVQGGVGGGTVTVYSGDAEGGGLAGTTTYSPASLNPGGVAAGTNGPATFHVTGEPGFAFHNIHSVDPVTVATGVTVDLNVNAVGPTGVNRTLNGSGINDYTVGGVLSLSASAAATTATYSGSWTETVAYN